MTSKWIVIEISAENNLITTDEHVNGELDYRVSGGYFFARILKLFT